MYRGLVESKADPEDWIPIIGARGGLGHMGIQYASKMGLKTIAIDSGDRKEICTSSGADVSLDFKTTSDIPGEVRCLTKVGASTLLVCAGTQGAEPM